MDSMFSSASASNGNINGWGYQVERSEHHVVVPNTRMGTMACCLVARC